MKPSSRRLRRAWRRHPRPADLRVQRDLFERFAGPLVVLAAAPLKPPFERALIQAAHHLHYDISPLVAIAFARVAVGARDKFLDAKSLDKNIRPYLKRLERCAVQEMTAREILLPPTGAPRLLTSWEEQQALQVCGELEVWFGQCGRARRGLTIAGRGLTIDDVNAKLAEFYPTMGLARPRSKKNDPERRLGEKCMDEINRRRSPRQQAIYVMAEFTRMSEQRIAALLPPKRRR